MTRISELRQYKGITQQELADIIGVKNYTIANWEQGRSEPSIIDLMSLADYFNCSIDYLVGREDDFGTITSTTTSAFSLDSDFYLKYKHLPKQKQQIIVEIVNDIYNLYKS